MNTTSVAAGRILGTAEQALEGGARIIQYRDKSDDKSKRLDEASALSEICKHYDALHIINDDPELALESGAEGVHVGSDDDSVREIRSSYPGLVIGASCYNSLDIAADMSAQGADYLAFGSFFPSPTKPQAVAVSIDTLVRAKQRFNLPLVAIGGIMASNAGALIESGADAVAVISAILDSDDPRRASMELSRLFHSA